MSAIHILQIMSELNKNQSENSHELLRITHQNIEFTNTYLCNEGFTSTAALSRSLLYSHEYAAARFIWQERRVVFFARTVSDGSCLKLSVKA